jgi:hypothetical protein
VQIDNAVTRPHAGPVSQQQAIGAPGDLHTAEAVARLRKLNYAAPTPQAFVNSADQSSEPRVMPGRTTLSY